MTVVVAVTSVISLSLIGDCRSGCDFRDLTEPHWSQPLRQSPMRLSEITEVTATTTVTNEAQ